MSQVAEQLELAGLGNVPDSYGHRDKTAIAGEPLFIGGGLLKWYDVAPPGEPVSPSTAALARSFLARECAAGRLPLDGDLGFVVLHRCGNDFHFLLPGVWRNANELWESVYAKDGPRQPDFAHFPLPELNHATYCVWELGPVWHERNAWRRYLMSARDETAKRQWLDDRFEGAC